MKIFLINPPLIAAEKDEHISPPLGLAYLAGTLRREGYEVSILDMAVGRREKIARDRYYIGKSWEEAGRELALGKPELVGIGCPFSSRFPLAKRAADLVHEILPKATVVMGGLQVSISPERVLKQSSADYIVVGEGEKVLPGLLEGLAAKAELRGIKGVGGFQDGEMFLNTELELPLNLDEIPHPARDLLDMESYISQNMALWGRRKKRQTPVITSRGCPQECTFCSVHRQSGRLWRGRSPENVLEELEILKRDYRIESVAFFDDNFALNRKRLRAICEGMIERKLKLDWIAPNGVAVSALEREMLVLMKEAGCSLLNLAVESGDEYILNEVIRKRLSLEKVREAAEICRELGIAANGYFVIGMPGETENSILRSLEFAESLPLRDVGVFIATPFPGTELFEQCVNDGYLVKEEAEAAFEGLPDDAVLHRAMIETPALSRVRAEFWAEEFHRRFWQSRFRKNPLLRLRLLAGRIIRIIIRILR